ncbi:MAG TPA: hypothetical protein VGN42_17430 [Pirellulales bacterium]|nr:hypothetical protein [Pirellulales bacterium]
MAGAGADRRRLARRSYRSLLCGLASFALLQAALSVAIDRWLPVLRDPEYGHKLARLCARRREQPDRPLVLVLGSSRSAMGLRPEALSAALDSPGAAPLVFNFGMTGYGPLQELALFHRLLRTGIRPERVLIEVHPLLLHQEHGYGEESWLSVSSLEWGDVSRLTRYLSHPDEVRRKWFESRLAPWYSRRFMILDQFAPRWVAPESRQNAWTLLDPQGWLPHHRLTVTAEEYRQGQDHARREYGPALKDFRVTPLADRALRELLDACAKESIPAALFVMPEGSEFRGWYAPSARQEIDEYLAGLGRQYGCPCYDATSWCSDEEFWDGHHLLPGGAARFSARFGRDALAPFLREKARASEAVAKRPPAFR